MSPPGVADQLAFLRKVQRLLSEGTFTASYKFALLLSLADLAVEQGDGSGDALRLPLEAIAERFIRYYWRQVLPYVPPGRPGEVLGQNTGRAAEIVTRLLAARERCEGSLARLQRQGAYPRLVRSVASLIERMPLFKLQTLGGTQDEFLYPNQRVGDGVELRPGVAFCLREFHPLIEDLVRSAWVRFLRRLPANQAVLGQAQDLGEFLFGSERADLSAYGPLLAELQAGRCFYCEGSLQAKGAAVDHFIPWSRYAVDLGHNFVLAHATCNAAKADTLAAVPHLGKWWRRNVELGPVLAGRFDARRIVHDVGVSQTVARWAYESAERAAAQVWKTGREFEPLDGRWRPALGG
jgi:hypothetical protein